MREDLKEKLIMLRTRKNVLEILHDQLEREYRQARQDYQAAFDEYVDHQESLCHKLIKSGPNPLYCRGSRGHEGECFARRDL